MAAPWTGLNASGDVLPDVVLTRTVTPVSFSGTSNSASRSIGAEAPERIVVGLVGWYGSFDEPLTSVTIGGVAATVIQESTGGGVQPWAALFYLEVPTGTSATVALNFAGSVDSGQLQLYAVYEADGLLDSGTAETGGDDISLALNVGAGGGVLAVFSSEQDSVAVTWSGISEVVDVDAGNIRYSSAAGAPLVADPALAVGANQPGGDKVLVAASFR